MDEDDRRPNPAKRKRQSSSNNGPTKKKRKHRLERKSTRQHQLNSKPHRHYPKSQSPLDQASSRRSLRWRESIAFAGTFDDTNHGYRDAIRLQQPARIIRDFLLTLIEVTFRPYPQRCCSFTAVVWNSYNGRKSLLTSLPDSSRVLAMLGRLTTLRLSCCNNIRSS